MLISDINGKIATSDKRISGILGQKDVFIANRLIASNAYGRQKAATVEAALPMGVTSNIQEQIKTPIMNMSVVAPLSKL